MLSAYLSDTARKTQVLDRLGAAMATNRILTDTGVWAAPTGSPAGVVAEDADLRRFEAFTGLPAAMGGLIDAIALSLSNTPEQRDQFLVRVFSAVRPGARMDLAAAQFLVMMHDDPALARAAAGALATSGLVAASRALQLDMAQDREVPRASWSALRDEAITLSAQVGGMALGACDFVERTAWPVARSRAVLSEGLGTLLRLASSQAIEDWGWSAEDQRRIDEALAAIEAEAQASGEENPNYPALLSAREPELEARFRQQIEQYGVVFVDLSEQWAKRLIDLLETY